MQDNESKATALSFAAIDKIYEQPIPSYEESENKSKNIVSWGDRDAFPLYLNDLYETTTTLRTVINTTSDFVVGDEIQSTYGSWSKEVNKTGQTLEELVGDLAKSYLTYGNAYVQVIRNKAGVPSELYSLSPKYVRTDKDCNIFHYSKDFGKKYGRTSNIVTYPKFIPDAVDTPASVIMLKTDYDNTYGLPMYISALNDCEVERALSEFGWNMLTNSFYGSYIIGFNNGIPSDEQKAELEREIESKFCSYKNASRILLTFANGKDNGVELQKLDIENYADKFNTTQDRASNKIYESFGAHSILFGVEKTTTGISFNSDVYKQSFKLYNKMRVMPIQKKIKAMLEKITGVKDVITIMPYTIDWGDDEKTETVE